MKEKVNVELSPELWLYIEGEYTKPEEENGFLGDFEIEIIEITKGDVIDYSLWCTMKNDCLYEIEQLCLEKLKVK